MADTKPATIEKRCALALEALGLEVDDSSVDQMRVFFHALEVFQERNRKYRDLWKRRGFLGTLLHLDSKALRLIQQWWEGNYEDAITDWIAERSVEVSEDQGYMVREPDWMRTDLDDALDLINYTAFFIRNVRRGNVRGES